MLLESLLLVGAVAVAVAMFMVLIYYSLLTEPVKPTDADQPTLTHDPVLDDDMVYLASSLYPSYEYVYFPTLPLNLDRQHAAQPA